MRLRLLDLEAGVTIAGFCNDLTHPRSIEQMNRPSPIDKGTPALSEAAVGLLRKALLGDQGLDLLRTVRQLSQRQAAGLAAQHGMVDVLREAGVVDAQADRLTDVGWQVADSAREYLWWVERERRLPAEGQHPGLSLANYANKDLLEVGCGFGCNLLSMGRMPGTFVGVEPVTVYRQLSPLLAERERLPAPRVVAGSGEKLPFEDGRFDVVVCISAHQYMDVRAALNEMARVLKPGGQLQVVGGVLSLRRMWRRWRQDFSLGNVKRDLLTLVNTRSYQRFGRRLYVPASSGSTSAPIYPSELFMRRSMREAGLRVREDWTRPLEAEFGFFADRPATPAATGSGIA
jgi:SAM-dependent methyltransferase